MNERKTENLVRQHLNKAKVRHEKDTGQFVWIEEQKSDKPNVQKLLRNASKKGPGSGHPEFIVTFENSNLLVVIECKADVRKHKSSTLQEHSDYAVDGALLYSSYLSNEFDVIAIGVSGEKKQEIQIDTFLQVKGKNDHRDLSISKLLNFEDYLFLLEQDHDKVELALASLTKYSKILNQRLRDDFDFEETYRPLIVSGILLALEDDSFCAGYKTKRSPKQIASLLLTAIKERLERDNIGEVKRETMLQTYGFLRANTKIINERNKDGTPNIHLKELIQETEQNVQPFSKSYKFHDLLGLFYIHFLKYANGDGGLGIVLTPHHITELFCKLAEVNKDSVVVDNCCGTGGFLISAMKKMEHDANGDGDKIKHIHTRQLIGIDNNPKMFCLACSNMMLRGDGKSNIYQQDCFEIDQQPIRDLKPTIALLNPPYAKKNEHKELEFIWNALSLLEPHGVCVAIVPQSCAMNTKKGNKQVKKRLLEEHTLKAVMSMPNSLFESSDKNAVTCILVFEAHKPHNNQVKTWFGYWKDDGFIKTRQQGRVDYYGKYKNRIKREWLDSYFDREERAGYSVLRVVDYENEWLVEPYIETNFEELSDHDFDATMRNYATFLFSNEIVGQASQKSLTRVTHPLDFSTWRSITLSQIFTICGTKTTDRKILEESHKGEKQYPYVTTQSTNNGARDFYDCYTEEGNVLTIDSAVAGFCAYQPFKFSASDHVEKLEPKFKMNVYRGLFVATIINKEQYRYSYGRKFNQTRIKQTKIKLPLKTSGDVDWSLIEHYMKSLRYSKSAGDGQK